MSGYESLDTYRINNVIVSVSREDGAYQVFMTDVSTQVVTAERFADETEARRRGRELAAAHLLGEST
jgi:hypothetical protein